MTATRRPAPHDGRATDVAALAGMALLLIAGTWWPVLTDVGIPLPQGPAARPAPESREEQGPSSLVDLNAADAAALERLPGLGPLLARRIVAHREAHGPFRTPEELAGVSGLGEKRLARLRPLVRLGEGP